MKNLHLSKFEADALTTPLVVARANVLVDLEKAKCYEVFPVIEWLEARLEALDKVLEYCESIS